MHGKPVLIEGSPDGHLTIYGSDSHVFFFNRPNCDTRLSEKLIEAVLPVQHARIRRSDKILDTARIEELDAATIIDRTIQLQLLDAANITLP